MAAWKVTTKWFTGGIFARTVEKDAIRSDMITPPETLDLRWGNAAIAEGRSNELHHTDHEKSSWDFSKTNLCRVIPIGDQVIG